MPDWWHRGRGLPDGVERPRRPDPHAGIADYDLFYFDAADLPWEGEDAVIRRAGCSPVAVRPDSMSRAATCHRD